MLPPGAAVTASVTCTFATTPFGITAGVSPYRMQRTDPDAGAHDNVFAAAVAAGPIDTARLETSAVAKPSVHCSPAGPFAAVEVIVRLTESEDPGAALPFGRPRVTCAWANPLADNTTNAVENVQRRAGNK